MKYKETIEITWYDPTEVPVTLTEVSGRSVDVIMKYSYNANRKSGIKTYNYDVMYYDKRSKQWLTSTNNEPLTDNKYIELLYWTYFPVALGTHLSLSCLIEQVQARCYDNFKRLEEIR